MSKEEQKKTAMDRLFQGLTPPASASAGSEDGSQQEPEEKSSSATSSRQKKYNEKNERVCTIMEIEDMNKLRYIAGKEGLAIRELFGISVKKLIKEYEGKNGVIPVRKSKKKKGDASKVFDL